MRFGTAARWLQSKYRTGSGSYFIYIVVSNEHNALRIMQIYVVLMLIARGCSVTLLPL